ncbi:hypothetical protein [Actinotalea sp.]|uniref:hypothetical protein n=1 Tax=Actinotalea sp. TaxID=1872145 RepID=UPI003568D4DB
MRHGRTILMLAAMLLLLAACAAGGNELVGTAGVERDPVGFWWGLWHGLIVPITFLVSLFTDTVNIYEVHNAGNWYDAGFVLGLTFSIGSGPFGASRRRSGRR